MPWLGAWQLCSGRIQGKQLAALLSNELEEVAGKVTDSGAEFRVTVSYWSLALVRDGNPEADEGCLRTLLSQAQIMLLPGPSSSALQSQKLNTAQHRNAALKYLVNGPSPCHGH